MGEAKAAKGAALEAPIFRFELVMGSTWLARDARGSPLSRHFRLTRSAVTDYRKCSETEGIVASAIRHQARGRIGQSEARSGGARWEDRVSPWVRAKAA